MIVIKFVFTLGNIFKALILVFIFTPYFVFSQKYLAGIEASPQGYYAIYSGSASLPVSSGFTPGFSIGIPVQFRLSAIFFIKSGLNYVDIRYKEIIGDVIFGQNIDPRSPNQVYEPPLVCNAVTNFKIKALDVPVKLIYNFSEKSNAFFISAGFTSWFLLDKEKNWQIENNGKILEQSGNVKAENFNNLIIFPTTGLGYHHQVSEKLILQVEQDFKYSLTTIRKQSILPERLLNLGFNVGLFYVIK